MLRFLSRCVTLVAFLAASIANAAQVYPPTGSPTTTSYVSGRPYTGTAYQALTVLDGDAAGLVAQGWTLAPPAAKPIPAGQVIVGTGPGTVAAGNDTRLTFSALTPTAVHVGQVGSGFGSNGYPNSFNNTNKQVMSRSPIRSKVPLTQGGMGLPCIYLTSGAGEEHTLGGTQTYTASFEYPAGTIVAVETFSGSTTGTCASSGATLQGDVVSFNGVTIPPGEGWVRIYQTGTNGILLTTLGNALDAEAGAAFASGISGVADQTQVGTPVVSTNTGATALSNRLSPVAIYAPTAARSVGLVGDSRCANVYDRMTASGDEGEVARGIGKFAPYLNACIGGDALSYYLGSNAVRTADLNAWTTDILVELGINDAQFGNSLATQQANYAAVKALFPGKPVTLTTHPPITSTATNLPISTLTGYGNTLSVVTPTAGMFVGETITIAGASPSNFNGPCIVTSIPSTAALYCTSSAASQPNGTVATGTITYTDNWATTINQTAFANDAIRTAVNTWIRTSAVTSGYKGYLEIADVVESSHNSSNWAVVDPVTGQPIICTMTDGVHETPKADTLIFNASANWAQIMN